MTKVLKLNSISNLIYDAFDSKYEVSDACENPDVIVVRSAAMADYVVPQSLLAVGRAGAGVNNIPHADYAKKGIVVFNTPGANANAVKELVIAGLLLSCRKIYSGINWAQGLSGQEGVAKLVEKGKSQFVGNEILCKTLGIIGLGAIGRLVADSAIALGMDVLGYDPYLSADVRLNDKITITDNLDAVYAVSDFITIHVPFMPSTNGFINADAISKMKDGVKIINAARGELVNNDDIISAVQSGKVGRYVTDFPTEKLLGIENIITIPHLGASTLEAEDNCAVMVSKQLADFVENGNIVNSVNYPTLKLPKTGNSRLTVLCKADTAILEQIKALFFEKLVNVSSAARGEVMYIIADLSSAPCDECLAKATNLDGVYKVRTC